MPAAAVIPAQIAYIKVVAVKKLVVGSWDALGSHVAKVDEPLRALTLGSFLARGLPAGGPADCSVQCP